MKRRTPPRAEKTAFAASPDVGENTDSDAKTPRGLNQNRRPPGRERHVAPRPERRGRPSARKAPACGRASVFRRSEEARRAETPARSRRLRRPKARRLTTASACASFCGQSVRPEAELRQAGHPAYSGRPAPWHGLRAEADGPDAPGRRTSPASARSLSVCAVKKRARRPNMAPKREKSNKKGFPLPDKAAKGKPCLCSWGSVNPCTSRRRCSCRKDEWSEPAHGSSSRRARPRSRTGCGRCPCVHGCP